MTIDRRGPWWLNDIHYNKVNDEWPDRSLFQGQGNLEYGWISGGILNTTARSHVQRIQYSNDTSTASLRGNLSYAVHFYQFLSNFTDGWVISGANGPSTYSTITRIDYSNDTSDSSNRTSLTTSTGLFPNRYVPAGGNTTDGWIIADTSTVIAVYRYTYASDDSSPVVRASPATPRATDADSNGSAGNNSALWFTLTSRTGNNPTSNTYKLEYANDTVGASTRGTTTLNPANANMAGNATNGWILGGGYGNPGGSTTISSNVQRITYASDTAQSAITATLFTAVERNAVTGNENSAWLVGSDMSAFPGTYITNIIRYDYASDNSMAVGFLAQGLSNVRSR